MKTKKQPYLEESDWQIMAIFAISLFALIGVASTLIWIARGILTGHWID